VFQESKGFLNIRFRGSIFAKDFTKITKNGLKMLNKKLIGIYQENLWHCVSLP
jgi:hypothetical protein